MKSAEDAIETLVRMNRFWRSTVLLLFGALAIVIICAAYAPKEIPDLLRTKRIVVGDPTGSTIELETRNGTAEMVMSKPADTRGGLVLRVREEEAVIAMVKEGEQMEWAVGHVRNQPSRLGANEVVIGKWRGGKVTIRVNQKTGKVEFVDDNDKILWSTP